LQSSSPRFVIPAGQTTGQFTVSAVDITGTAKAVTIKATVGGITKGAKLRVKP